MSDIVFYASIVIGVYILFKFSGKILSKVIGLVLFIIVAFTAAYLLGFGPFKPNFTDIYSIQEKFCEGEQKNDTICDCIVQPLMAEYKEKFTEEELQSLAKDKPESAYVFAKIIQAIKDDSDECLDQKGENEAWGTFFKATLPFNIGLDKLDGLKEKFGDYLDDKKDRKKELDEKFED